MATNLNEDDFKRYSPAIRNYFRRRVAAYHVDDLVQDTFLALHSRQAKHEILALTNYLFVVAANVLRRHQRMELARDDIREASTIACQEPDPERITLGKDALRRATQAFDEMPPRTREIFLMHRFDDMTYAEIAETKQISVSAVEKHIMTALRRLKYRVDAAGS